MELNENELLFFWKCGFRVLCEPLYWSTRPHLNYYFRILFPINLIAAGEAKLWISCESQKTQLQCSLSYAVSPIHQKDHIIPMNLTRA